MKNTCDPYLFPKLGLTTLTQPTIFLRTTYIMRNTMLVASIIIDLSILVKVLLLSPEVVMV